MGGGRQKSKVGCFMAATDTIALKLEDQDDDCDSGIAGHQEEVYVDLECSDT